MDSRVKRWNTTSENVAKLVEKVKAEGIGIYKGMAKTLWGGMAKCIRKLAKDVLRVSKGHSRRMRGAWW